MDMICDSQFHVQSCSGQLNWSILEKLRGERMDLRVYLFYLLIPVSVILVIIVILKRNKARHLEQIDKEVVSLFEKIWNSNEPDGSSGELSFTRMYYKLFQKTYLYEEAEEMVNKSEYYIFKLLVLFVILTIPLLVVFLMTKKEFIFGDNEWSYLYLCIAVLLPLSFAYLLKKYIDMKQYRPNWIHHARVKINMEWKMMEFIKNYELQKIGKNEKEIDELLTALKVAFINETSILWKESMDNSPELDPSKMKEFNLIEEIGAMLQTDVKADGKEGKGKK